MTPQLPYRLSQLILAAEAANRGSGYLLGPARWSSSGTLAATVTVRALVAVTATTVVGWLL